MVLFGSQFFFWGVEVLLSFIFKEHTILSFVEKILIYCRFIEMIITLYLFLRWYYKIWKISPQKIIANEGVFYRKQIIVAIKNIETITVNQNILQKMCCVGTIVLSAPTLKKTVKIMHVAHPFNKARKIEYLLPKTDEKYRHTNDAFILS